MPSKGSTRGGSTTSGSQSEKIPGSVTLGVGFGDESEYVPSSRRGGAADENVKHVRLVEW